MESFRYALFFANCALSVIVMRPMPKAGVLVLSGGALLLALSQAVKDAGMHSSTGIRNESRVLRSDFFLMAAIFLAGATFHSVYTSDCTLAVIYWALGLLILICLGNELSWRQICMRLSPRGVREFFANRAFQRRIVVYGTALIVSAFLNFFYLTSIPYNIHGDEGEIAERARLIPILSEFFRPQAIWWHLPAPSLLLQRIGFLVGDGLWGIRAGPAFYGVIANILILGFLRSLVSPWLAAGCWVLIVTSPNLLQSYRQGLDVAVPILLASLFVGLTVRVYGAPGNRLPRMILIGCVLGLSMVVYVSARSLLVGWAIIGTLMVLSAPTLNAAWRLVREISVSWAVALLVMGPMVSYSIANPQVPRVRGEYEAELKEDFVTSRKTVKWFAMLDTRVAGALSTLFTQKERVSGDFYFYFAGLLPLSVVVLAFSALASPWPLHRSRALILVAAACGLVLALGIPLRSYDRFHRVVLVFPFFAAVAAIGLAALSERIRWRYVRLQPVILFGCCTLLALHQVKTYVQTHGDGYEWEFVSAKTRAARTLQSVLRELPQSRIYCVAEPWFSCSNGTFRLLIPGVEHRAVNFSREAFQTSYIPMTSGQIVILSAGFEPLKDARFSELIPPGTKTMEWNPRSFQMGEAAKSDHVQKDIFSAWQVPSAMPSRAPDITITGLVIP
jgi:hypothetical protein